MGRLASKRRVKSLDPFSKTGGKALPAGGTRVSTMDLAPRGGDDDEYRGLKRLPSFLQPEGGIEGIGPGAKRRAKKRRREEKAAAGGGGKASKAADGSKARADGGKGAGSAGGPGSSAAAAAAPAEAAAAKRPAATLMPQLERQAGESLRKFKGRLREAAKAAMLHNREKGGGYRRVSESRRSYMNRKAAHQKNQRAAKLVSKAESKPGLGGQLLRGLHGKTVLPTSDHDDSDSDSDGPQAVVPKDIEIEQAVLARGVHTFGERAEAPPEIRLTGRLARMAPAKRTLTEAERLMLRAAEAKSKAAARTGAATKRDHGDDDSDSGDEGAGRAGWQGGLHRRERALGRGGSSTGGPAGAGLEAAEAGKAARLVAARAEAMAAYSAARQRKSQAVRRAAHASSAAGHHHPMVAGADFQAGVASRRTMGEFGI
ncbi:hypothetical protein FNF29_04392 [Cafeteria roenbergensis]|uniref:Uncharacterized protein n=1 Tax=Cafeteria roenbergensis TaxID=33653 RepID=A0A5A8CFD2_CAFRO|nr:hypothetical protein FNF29_04392 [Cafeteria roenbergensis]|eukprot:KAA0151705.1 hypothetical protein FNF29_04392 [Cafeteria roenbergensis]